MTDILTYTFDDDGRIPNNPDLPLLIYSGAVENPSASTIRSRFEQSGWGGAWVNGVFSYHHYHSTAHEVLGVASGSAKIQFGGENGEIITVTAGDVAVLPAGMGHCLIEARGGFRVVGAYPAGQSWDLCTGKPDERPQVLHNIANVPLPASDPVYGADGPLREYWK